MPTWHIETDDNQIPSGTQVNSDAAPLLDEHGHTWVFSKGGETVLLVPRARVLYMKRLK